MGNETEHGQQADELFAGFIPVTAEGKARARAKLNAAKAAIDPAKRAALRERLGMAPKTA